MVQSPVNFFSDFMQVSLQLPRLRLEVAYDSLHLRPLETSDLWNKEEVTLTLAENSSTDSDAGTVLYRASWGEQTFEICSIRDWMSFMGSVKNAFS